MYRFIKCIVYNCLCIMREHLRGTFEGSEHWMVMVEIDWWYVNVSWWIFDLMSLCSVSLHLGLYSFLYSFVFFLILPFKLSFCLGALCDFEFRCIYNIFRLWYSDVGCRKLFSFENCSHIRIMNSLHVGRLCALFLQHRSSVIGYVFVVTIFFFDCCLCTEIYENGTSTKSKRLFSFLLFEWAIQRMCNVLK